MPADEDWQDDWIDGVFDEAKKQNDLERFWSACVDEFTENPAAEPWVLMKVYESLRQLDHAEGSSNFYRGEQPEVDAAFDAVREAFAHLREILGDSL